MSKCEVCNERRGLMVNYAPGDAVWMAHPECAARHFQIRVKELEDVEMTEEEFDALPEFEG